MTGNWILEIAHKIGLTFSYVDMTYDGKIGRAINRWVLLMPGSGCAWAKKENGGCFMCGFNSRIAEVRREVKISPAVMMQIYNAGASLIAGKGVDILAVYNAGSFLNDKEIPLEVQLKICENVRKSDSIRTLFIESRPEYVSQEKIGLMISRLGGKELKVGLGLECVSDEIREKSINKGFSRRDFERAVRILKDNGAKVLTYIFIKPLYLSEREAILEAIRSTEYAFGVGSDEVTLEAALVQKGTKMEKLYRCGGFRPPWLWSIIEVLKAAYGKGIVNVGDFSDEPPPIAVPYNCSKCSQTIVQLFKNYKETHKIELFDKLDCDCRLIWEKEALGGEIKW